MPGRDAASRVDVARRQLADLIGCAPGEIIFTSGATEANNLALRAAYASGGVLAALYHKCAGPAYRQIRQELQVDSLRQELQQTEAFLTHVHRLYLDYHTAMADAKGFLKDELSDDGLHPNARGYAVMAPLAERAVAAALKRKR